MRAKAIPAPSRKGKRRLLESCAIMAGLAALAYGGPALAQVAGTGQAVSGSGLSIPVISPPGPGATSVNTTGDQTIINWTPTDTATTGGAIDFLPTGNTLTFNGTGNYTVLNRFVNGAGGSLSRQIALNGTINSMNSAAAGTRGGNIWFYNAGGILIGASGVINVGSLVLTTNDVLTTGGLFGPSGEIRFRGAANSTAAITVNGAINADYTTNPGGAYVALVAPRVVQSGNVRVDGSAAYVAAEQADIRINGGLFDINVLVGAEGGNAITHTGDTTGPAHQQGDTDQSRIYMVAIPKNDAVTMLVSGQVGYDDALSAQVDPDGAVRLSAGYNVTNGELNTAPANATAANITVNDTLFRSNTIARASGAFVGQPLQLVPMGAPGPVPPPPEQGRIFVEGDGTFIGDASATLNINAGRIGGATGNLTVQSGGVGATPGNASVNVNGGQFGVGGNLTVSAPGLLDATTGNSRAGTASLNVTGGGLAIITGTTGVIANATAGIGTNGESGNGRGGTATVSVSGTGSVLLAGNVLTNAIGTGAGLITLPFGTIVADVGGDGFGGNAGILVEDGASLSVSGILSATASGRGQIGLTQSGNGQGGTARIAVTGTASSLQAQATFLAATGTGGGNFSNPVIGTFDSLSAGSGRGGQASIEINADATSTINFGDTTVGAGGFGGDATGENSVGGDGRGGTASVTGAGGATAQFVNLTLNTAGIGGSASSPSGQTSSSGNGIGGDVNVTATVGTTLAIDASLALTASGLAGDGDTIGSGEGGTVLVSVESGGNINVNDQLIVDVVGGSFGPAVFALGAGSGTGGDVDLTAIGGGAIRADSYLVNAAAGVVNVSGANGAAQGGTIDVTASSTGQILATNDGNHFFDTSAATGVSTGGSSATGGTIRFIADAGAIDMGAGATLAAGGISGGATNPGPNSPVGSGGTILVQLVADALDSSAISLGGFNASADGWTAVNAESAAGVSRENAGIGQGGTIGFDVQGGTLTASGINVSADGFGGNVAGGNAGFGGTASFSQTGGSADIGSLIISADGFGGVTSGQSGSGIGGTTTVDLLGGAITATGITARANGQGGQGFEGNDDDPANIIAGGQGGNALGGTATVNIAGSAIVTTETISANAAGFGGIGGDFVNISSFGGVPGTPGNGGDGVGGNATVEVTGGTTAATGLVANAAGIGGDGGSSFFSSSSGGATGVGVGGRGGTGQGGTATVALQTAIDAVGTASSIASGIGGNGGDHNVGGAGGDGFGGIAQAIVTNFDAGQLAVTLDTTGLGGNGADGRDGAGGEGGDGIGGTSRLFADGPDAGVTVTAANFITGGTGGNGGNAQLGFGSFVLTAPSGGHGGDGRGGTTEVIANEGATVSLAIPAGGTGIVFDAISTGGNGGNGANSVFDAEALSGDGGFGGGGYGGTVRLLTNGGTITSNGAAVEINATGAVGTGGAGGIGQGGGSDGAAGGSFGTVGGRVIIEALNGLTGPGQIALGNTSITASGDIAGRIELRAEGNLGFQGLAAEALGFADPTNNDTSDAPAGIFLAMTGGTIASQADVVLTTDSSVGAYAQSNGIFDVTGALTINAGDQIDIRHEFREGPAPTIRASGSLFATALTSISGAPGSLLGAGDTLSLTTTGVTGGIGLDRLDGVNIILGSNGAVSVEHAEATNDFTASGASFRTGPNSIITGGDISVTSTGAIDLGNSTAGGMVFVEGQSIDFIAIDAGTTVSLRSLGLGAFEGVNGDNITAGGNVALNSARGVTVDNLQIDGSLSVNANNGPATLGSTTAGGNILVFANGNVIGTFRAGGNISLRATGDILANANAAGGYADPATGLVSEGSVLVDANGAATMFGGSAATMFGVRAGGSVALEDVTAGEDVFVLAGTTANLTAITAGDDLSVRADGAIDLSNAQTTGTGPDGRSVVYQACCSNPSPFLQIQTSAADLSNVTLLAPTSTISATNSTAFDNFTATAGGAVTATGLIRSGLATNITGSSLNLVAITAGTDIVLTANTGGVSATGALAAGNDVGVSAIGAVNVSEFDAGDDVRVTTNGALTIGAAYSYGTGVDSEGDGSNIVLAAAATDITHAEADNDFIAEAASFTTGLDSIITGGDINIAAAGAVDLGNSTAGGFVQVNGQSIAFNNINAGTTVGLNATGTAVGAEGIRGGSITAGGSVNLFGNSIAITGTVDSAASLFASASGGNAAIGLADVDGNIVVVTNGNIGGSYTAGGNITLTAGGNIVAQANAAGGYVDPNSIASEGYVFADADGNATLTNSSAATMLGVRAGQAASVSNATAGEDGLVIAGTTATLTNITAGDDLTATAPGGITANGLTTTGAGPGNRTLFYGPSAAAGVNIFQITTAAADLSNITLTASAGNIGGGNLNAFDNLTATASGTVTTTGLLRSGLATTVSGSALSFNAITAGTDVDLTATTGGIASTGALAAGHDLTIDAAGNVGVSELNAGDDIRIDAGGTLAVGAAYSYGTGVDDEGDGSNIVIAAGATNVDHAEADNDFIVNAASFRTGLNSIIAGGNIDIVTAGASDLGNATAGGSIAVDAQSIAFNALDAGTTIDLTAGGTAAGFEGIDGGAIVAGGDINLGGNSIALTGPVTGDASLFATGSGGSVAINQANLDGSITVVAAGNLTGTYAAGGDIRLNSGANVNASATASGTVGDGNLFVDAAGNVVLANSAAARMFGVNAGGSATITDASAGEDFLALTGTTASLADITAGDDVDIRATGGVTANNVTATGAGADTHLLNYLPASGFTIMQGEGVSAVNGSDVFLSAGGSIAASALSAGDDIVAIAGGTIGIAGADTLGLGATGGGSNIRTQGGATTLSAIDAFNDVLVDATGLANLTGPVAAGRNATINAGSVSLAALTDTGGAAIPTLSAGGDVVVNSAAGITGGGVRALGDAALTAGTAIGITSVEGQDVTLTGAAGITVDAASVLGTTTLDSSDGDIRIASLLASGPINASANAIRIEGGGNMHFATLTTDVGDAYVRGGGDFSVASGAVAGTADLATQGEAMNIGNLTAANAIIANTGGFLNLDTVTIAGSLDATTLTSLGVNGVVTGRSVSLASASIGIASTGRVGTAGTTESVSIANNNSENQTFIGGTGTPDGYHLDADELTRVFGTDIEIFAPEVQVFGGLSVGSATPPDVIVDGFTMTGGTSTSNLGANRALTIRTPGKMRVIGNVQLTGLTDANALNLVADRALEVILGRGTVRLVNGTNPAGQLNMVSDDIIVATEAAIADVGAAATTDAIETRLAENDGVLLDEGALFARGIRAEVVGGFYVQNSGTGTRFANRRGLTFGAGGLDVLTEEPSRIVINGVHLGPNGQVTGLDTIPLLTIAGTVPAPGSFDPRSTFNGCLITGAAACTILTLESNFPVQDVIEKEADPDGDDGDGNILPTPLITMRDLDPLSGEPLLDDPVTGAGNDDLWTPTLDACDPASAAGGSCPAAE